MKTSKYVLLTLVFVLLSGLGAGVMAQRKGSAALRLPPEPIGSVARVNAIEVTDGLAGFDSEKQETQFGYSFLGRTTGAFPGSFTLSMNCSPAIAVPGETTFLKGGSWTLPVYITEVKGGYAGSLYGTIAEGKMIWDKTGPSANVYIVLTIDGGTQSWSGVTGYATFTGTLTAGEKGQKTTLTGDMVFTYTNLTVE
ncbi:MAG TPA: hypothetical protein VNO50_23035 [Pyrinomonadaceae bacterium]|nr:hypothetical protein [Pyrinomonadaceae bacterium]